MKKIFIKILILLSTIIFTFVVFKTSVKAADDISKKRTDELRWGSPDGTFSSMKGFDANALPAFACSKGSIVETVMMNGAPVLVIGRLWKKAINDARYCTIAMEFSRLKDPSQRQYGAGQGGNDDVYRQLTMSDGNYVRESVLLFGYPYGTVWDQTDEYYDASRAVGYGEKSSRVISYRFAGKTDIDDALICEYYDYEVDVLDYKRDDGDYTYVISYQLIPVDTLVDRFSYDPFTHQVVVSGKESSYFTWQQEYNAFLDAGLDYWVGMDSVLVVTSGSNTTNGNNEKVEGRYAYVGAISKYINNSKQMFSSDNQSRLMVYPTFYNLYSNDKTYQVFSYRNYKDCNVSSVNQSFGNTVNLNPGSAHFISYYDVETGEVVKTDEITYFEDKSPAKAQGTLPYSWRKKGLTTWDYYTVFKPATSIIGGIGSNTGARYELQTSGYTYYVKVTKKKEHLQPNLKKPPGTDNAYENGVSIIWFSQDEDSAERTEDGYLFHNYIYTSQSKFSTLYVPVKKAGIPVKIIYYHEDTKEIIREYDYTARLGQKFSYYTGGRTVQGTDKKTYTIVPKADLYYSPSGDASIVLKDYNGITRGGYPKTEMKVNALAQNILISFQDASPVSYPSALLIPVTLNASPTPTLTPSPTGTPVPTATPTNTPTPTPVTGAKAVIQYVDVSKCKTQEEFVSGKIIGDKKEVGITTLNETVPATVTINGLSYNYAGLWRYGYTKKGTTRYYADFVTGNSIGFSESPDTDILYIYIYVYNLELINDPYTPVAVPITGEDKEKKLNTASGFCKPYSDYYYPSTSISSNETFNLKGGALEFLTEAYLKCNYGTRNYSIPVTRTYVFSYTDDNGVYRTETVKKTANVSIGRSYRYWNIEKFGIYTPKSMEVTLPFTNGTITMQGKNGTTAPSSVSKTYSSHLTDPSVKTIDLGTAHYEFAGGRPDIDLIFAYESRLIADVSTGEIVSWNDYLSFDGKVILDDSKINNRAVEPDILPLQKDSGIPKSTDDTFFVGGTAFIPPETLNGNYTGTATITYASLSSSVNAEASIKCNASMDGIAVHTPVVCAGTVTSDNDKYVQLINPDRDAVALVLDEDSTYNDFTVHISNTGRHKNALGYLNRDYKTCLSDNTRSHIAKTTSGQLYNEVLFPFDVYVDINNDGDRSNDVRIEKNTWITIGERTQRFYLPIDVKEGIYECKLRTIAVNGLSKLSWTEKGANLSQGNYVATDSFKVEVSGRLYGLTVYDINNSRWKDVFRKGDIAKFSDKTIPSGIWSQVYNSIYRYDYAVGTKDLYGVEQRLSKYTVPFVKGSSPRDSRSEVLRKGETVRFSVKTKGTFESTETIELRPRFYWVDSNGQNRTEVNLYYTVGNDKLVKAGSAKDINNTYSFYASDKWLSINRDLQSDTASFLHMSLSTFRNQSAVMLYGVSKVTLSTPFRVYTNKSGGNLSATQEWFGNFSLPASSHVVPVSYDVETYASRYGIDFTESFWKKDGYIIVRIDVVTTDKDGNERLSYINGDNYQTYGNCSMWVTEGAPLTKTGTDGVTFTLKAGDFLIYDLTKTATDDYTTGGIY